MKVINLFGAPGAGKSTAAAGVFSALKDRGENAELVTEFAKDLTWDNSLETLEDQLFVTATQNHRLERLRDKVDWVVTDSPIPTGLFYHPKYDNFYPLVMEIFNSYDNVNFLIERSKEYNPEGRTQTVEESDKIYKVIVDFLYDRDIRYSSYTSTNAREEILNKIL